MSLIKTTDELAELCHKLAEERYITVDTEFLRDKTYYPKLCLVQVAGKEVSCAIDVLAKDMDMTPLFALLDNSAVLKVFHSARQDIEIIYNLTGKIPAPLFDTQVAAMVCGFGEAVSYEVLARKFAGIQLDKSSRFTDWSRRPLTKKQLAYAISDVVHLRVVYEKLIKKLQENGRTHWLTEEMETLTDPQNYANDPEFAWERIRVRSGQSPRFIKRVQELAKWREITAKKRDLPRNHIIKEQTLLEIAASAPQTIDALRHIRGLGKVSDSSPMVEEILAVMEEVENLPEDQLPPHKPKRAAPKNGALTELLKVLLKMQSDDQHVAAKLIATSDDLALIAAEKNADVPAMQGWRYEVFGQYAESLKEGKIALSAKGNKMLLIELTPQEKTAN